MQFFQLSNVTASLNWPFRACLRMIIRNRETVFRGVVLNDGVQACDILQVWLDVAQHPSRATEQANLIWRKVLAAALVDRDENESGSERPIEALDRSLGQIVMIGGWACARFQP